ncbi:unnamed protein product [Miscanthus lutarioriparius]|uniref:Uncharacterized protein n=1 Tax=Miscanthus lutarioriparius TaxID=422564 RepID=A0A811RDM9_9POAL|nr:unnamed protein product [Miscanthus lutarioriparius]
MALQDLVDWRGRPVNQKKQGGVRASVFIHFLIVMSNMANIPMIMNLVTYLHGTMHMDVKDASTTSTNFFGAICFFSFLGAFISDSYIKRFYTILIFAPIEILGYMLLAYQARFPSLHSPPCDMINNPSDCTPVSGRNLSLLTLGLYLIPVGESSVRTCAAALGGDQFDEDSPAELPGKISFFNWFEISISLGAMVGVVFLVWVQDNAGWDLGFALAALMVLVGTLGVAVGLPLYRHQKPAGSPITRILQVFVAAFRKRKLRVPENLMEMHSTVTDGTGTSVESMDRTAGFMFLDKAAVDDGNTRAWSLCTVAQVEEAKTLLRMIPIFLSSILAYIPFSLLLSLTVEQAGTMDTRLGGITVPPASLTVIPVAVQILILLVYDRAVMPWLRRATGYAGGLTHLQRAGVGFASSVLAIATAAAVEGRRRRRSGPPMSAFCLAPQLVLLCVLDVTSFVGLLEFFYSEVSAGMKSIGGSLVFCILGVASWLGSLLIQVVNDVTARRGGGSSGRGHGWLGGANLNASRLDLFYWLLAVLGLVSFGLYVLCAWSYTYRHDPRMQATTTDGSDVADQHTC